MCPVSIIVLCTMMNKYIICSPPKFLTSKSTYIIFDSVKNFFLMRVWSFCNATIKSEILKQFSKCKHLTTILKNKNHIHTHTNYIFSKIMTFIGNFKKHCWYIPKISQNTQVVFTDSFCCRANKSHTSGF